MDTIYAGDTLTLNYTFDGYDPATYDIWIALRGNKVAVIDIKTGTSGVTVTESGQEFQITVTATATAAWTAGKYSYAIYMTTSTTRDTVETGTVEIKQNIAALTIASDVRSHAKKTLDAIEAVIEGRASRDDMRYQIGGRMLERMTITDLLKFRDIYRAEYNREVKAEKIANGDGIGGLLKVRF